MTHSDALAAEYDVLSLMTPDTKKFGLQLGYAHSQDEQFALERLMLRDWIRLIDLSTASEAGTPLIVFSHLPGHAGRCCLVR